jgi:hypothetical protein
MDTNTLFVIVALLSGAVAVYGIRSFNAVRIRELDRKIADSRRMAKVRAGASRAQAESEREAPDWLFDTAEELGLGDYLDSDEMPPELEKLLPMAKGFIQSGGLQKLLGSAKEGSGPAAAPNEPGWF